MPHYLPSPRFLAVSSVALALALFAFSLFTGQSVGVAITSRFVDSHGTMPVFLAAGAGLALLAFVFERQLAARRRTPA